MKKSFRIATLIQYCNRLVTMFGGLVVLWVATRVLSAHEFGLFISLQSVVQLRLFADAIGGGGIVAMIVKSNELDRESIISVLEKMYGYIAAAVAVFAVGIVVTIYSGVSPNELKEQSLANGLLVIFATPAAVILAGRAIVLEGKQDVVNAAMLRLILSGGYVIAVIAGLYFGAGTASVGLAAVGGSAIGLAYLVTIKRLSVNPLSTPIIIGKDNAKPLKTTAALSPIWSLQWRMLMSWAGGYGMIFLPAPIILYAVSPELAGSVGMTLQLLQSLAGLALIPLTIRLPLLSRITQEEGANNAKRKYKVLQRYVLSLYAISILLLLSFFSDSANIAPDLYEKLPSFDVFTLYSLGFLWCVYFYTESIKYRAMAREPFWYIYLFGGLMHVCIFVGFGYFDKGREGALALAISNFILFFVIVRLISRRLEKKHTNEHLTLTINTNQHHSR